MSPFGLKCKYISYKKDYLQYNYNDLYYPTWNTYQRSVFICTTYLPTIFVTVIFKIYLILPWGHTQTMWTAMGGGGSWNVHFTNNAYLVKLSTKGGGGSKKSKKRSTWLVHGPFTAVLRYLLCKKKWTRALTTFFSYLIWWARSCI